MDWRLCCTLIVLTLFPFPIFSSSSASATSSRSSTHYSSSAKGFKPHQNEISPYIDLLICPIRNEAWSCARQQSARILDLWDNEVYSQWQKLKVEADRQLNATVEKRGYSASEIPTKEKPSSLLKKIEIGTKFMKEFLAQTMDGFLGREYEYMESKRGDADADADADTDTDTDDVDDNDNNNDTDNETNEDEQNDYENSVEENSSKNAENDRDSENENENETDIEPETDAVAMQAITDNTSNGIEFIEIEKDDGEDAIGQLKRPEGKKKKKKGQQGGAPATVLVVQQPAVHTETESHGHGGGGGGGGGHGHGGKPLKQKRKKRKKHQQQQHGGEESVLVVEEEPSFDHHHIGLGLLEGLADADDLLDIGGGGGGKGKRKRKHPSNYGRSNGVTRGKKKKKKKALMKLILLGSFLKAKIELLLKILGAHLQIKFFAIALIGLLINIARFWIDVKRGGAPQKVVYVEHAHHQHHYEDHGDDWSEQGSYWKRSLQTDPTVVEEDSHTDSYQLKPIPHQNHHQQQQQQQPQQQQQQQYAYQQHQQPHDAHYMAYRGQWQ